MGGQSTLDPAGQGAEQIAQLWWAMLSGATVIWLAMTALWLYASLRRSHGLSELQGRLLIVGGGIALPALILAVLLGSSLPMLSELLAPAPAGALRIVVTGEQWWWRVRYPSSQGDVELANEIRLPVGEPVEFELHAADVIHSFWIPSLGGKMDMIPGHRTRLLLLPERTGRFRGVCAEYCGSAHALMAFDVVVLEKEEFALWLQAQRAPARAAAAPLSAHGGELFVQNGCGACHTIRGSEADGVVGPDLTHAGSRSSLGAGTVGNDPASFADWIAGTERLKPGVHMPAFDMLEPRELEAMAAYLESLQ